MANIEVTCVEGVDQFHAEGDAETVERLLAEWRQHVTDSRREAMQFMNQNAGSMPGPRPDPTSPFAGPTGPRRIVS